MQKVFLVLLLLFAFLAFPIQALEIQYLGHSSFLITFDNGFECILDPFSPQTGYSIPEGLDADILISTHEHFDHLYPDFLGKPVEVLVGTKNGGAEWNLFDRTVQGIHIFALPSYHDSEQGKSRGKNSIIVLEGDGMRLAHLGDIGAFPGKEEKEKLEGIDVLFAPVGGHYTLSIEDVIALIEDLSPRVVIPMHYRTKITRDWPIAPLEEFLSRAERWKAVKKGNSFHLQRENLPEHMEIWVLESPGE